MSTQSTSEFLIRTPPYCPTVECYEHGNGQEHHVEGCPVYGTIASAMHRLNHAFDAFAASLRPIIDDLWPMMPRRVRWAHRLRFSPVLAFVPHRVRYAIADVLTWRALEDDPA
jgi:hypothetical protein